MMLQIFFSYRERSQQFRVGQAHLCKLLAVHILSFCIFKSHMCPNMFIGGLMAMLGKWSIDFLGASYLYRPSAFSSFLSLWSRTPSGPFSHRSPFVLFQTITNMLK
eukprot:GHVP01048015.1.p1 GENE.GHVP01048015.1~~GHVP01048015.1.p1  ORF type:complete len:106 (+),score=0.39 GHVP01048015.1:131-448(+)